MGTLIGNITNYYRYVNDDLADPRTNNFLLVSSPIPILLIMYLYHRFVSSWGPTFMAKREPYNLKKVIILYNVVQIGLSAYLTLQTAVSLSYFFRIFVLLNGSRANDGLLVRPHCQADCSGQKITTYHVPNVATGNNYHLLTNACPQQSTEQEVRRLLRALECLTRLYLSGYYSLWCQKIIYEDTPLERVVVSRVWLYYMIKIIDLMDTIFFVLRKKFNQVSFLHVYHHLGMCLLGFVGTKYVPGGHGIMLGFINSMVHAVMYTYYLISIVRPQWVRQWWKKHITQLQILQFVILILHFGHVLFEPSCEYPKWISFMFLPHNIFILFLFSDFYIKEYMLKKNKNKTK